LLIKSKKVTLRYQDICNLTGDRVVAREALLSPSYDGQNIAASVQDIITAAEHSARIDVLGLLILEQACRDALAWGDGCGVSVNVSAVQLRSGDFDERVIEILERTRFPAERLALEITETAALETGESVHAQLSRLVGLGIGLSLDDFGVGYSCLQSLWKLPFTALKIDGTFIRAAESCERCYQIVRSMGELGRRLQIDLIAEGIENRQQLALAQQAGCRQVQGYLFSRPRLQERVLADIREAVPRLPLPDAPASKIDWGSVALPLGFIDEISDCDQVADIIATVSRWASVLLGADRASITMKQDADTLVPVHLDGREGIPQGHPLPIAETVVGRVYKSGVAEICADLSCLDDLDSRMLHEAGFRSSMIVPLSCGDRCFGTLNVARIAGRYTEDDKRRLQSLSNWLTAQIQMRLKINELSSLANVDSLTGTLVRKAFLKALQEMARQGRFCLVLVDIDELGAINRRLGHSAGDLALIEVAEILLDRTRQDGDVVGRIGGDEFGVLLKGADAAAAQDLFARVNRATERHPLRAAEQRIGVSVSCGVVSAAGAGLDVGTLLHQAEAALCAAKAETHRCVVRNL
jgi:diguanylate cyclase (GGDEF)-like protein